MSPLHGERHSLPKNTFVHLQAVFSCHDGPWHEFADGINRMTVGQFGKGLGQPCLRVDIRGLAVHDQGGDHPPVFAALVRAGEQGVLAIEGWRPDRPLDCVGNQLDTAVIQEQR